MDSTDGIVDVCEFWIRGKLSTKYFPSSTTKIGKLLKLIHSNLCGPMLVASIGGNHYILMLVDNYSRYTVIEILKMKDQVASHPRVCFSNED